MRISFAVEAGSAWGSGHVVRSATLAEALGRHHQVSFVTPTPEPVRRILATFGLRKRVTAAQLKPAALAAIRSDVVIIDHLNTERGLVRRLRADGTRVITFDDRGPGASDADLVVNAIVGLWDRGSSAKLLEGPRYLVLSPAFVRSRRLGPARPYSRIVLALGGYPDDQVVSKVRAVLPPGLHVVSPGGFAGERARPLAPILASATAAITNGGLSMYESLALGVPTIAVPQAAIERRGVRLATIRAAVLPSSLRDLPDRITSLLSDRRLRATLRRNATDLVDGRGLERVLTAIQEAI